MKIDMEHKIGGNVENYKTGKLNNSTWIGLLGNTKYIPLEQLQTSL
jgi:hypothetical protein